MSDILYKRAIAITSNAGNSKMLAEIIRRDCSITFVGTDLPLHDSQSLARLADLHNIDVAFIETSLSENNRSEHKGIKVGQYLRRECFYKGYIVFLGYLPQMLLAHRFSIVGPNIPGGEYVQLPAKSEDICSAAKRAYRLSESQFRDVLLIHCGVREELRANIHQLSNLMTQTLVRIGRGLNTSLDRSKTLCDLTSLQDKLNHYGFGYCSTLITNMIPVLSQGQDEEPTRVRKLLQRLNELEQALFVPSEVGESEGAYLNYPAPSGYNTILIADDDDYPAEGVHYLEERGYSVNIVCSYEEAGLTLTADPPDVFVCDQTFGEDSRAGRKLMALAQESVDCKFVIALSGSILTPAEVPEADAICAGPTAKTEDGARLLHTLICKWAMSG
jgi:CheY-like chemotaxis protein